MSELNSANEKDDHWKMPTKFYVVSIKKFLALFLFTNGVYLYYWFYRNWKMYKLVMPRERVLPMANTIFMYFFIYPLLSRIEKEYRENPAHGKWSPLLYAALLTVLLVTWQIVSRVPDGSEYEKYVVSLCSAILILMAMIGIKIQKVINAACGDLDGITNEKFSIANWLWVCLGSILWALIIYGQALGS